MHRIDQLVAAICTSVLGVAAVWISFITGESVPNEVVALVVLGGTVSPAYMWHSWYAADVRKRIDEVRAEMDVLRTDMLVAQATAGRHLQRIK